MNRRISKPPGGDTSDIFTTPNSTPPSTPRKVKNYMASNIFTPADAEARSVRQRPDDNSFKKLFGTSNGTADTPDGGSPRGKNYQKSNVLFPQANGSANGHVNGNGKSPSAHNGDSHENGSNGTASGSSSGSATPSGSICGDIEHPKTNGTSNGVASTNGSTTNGSSTNGVNGAVNGAAKPAATNSKRIPPGGFSTKLW